MSDQLLVQNSKAMQAILQATQAEAEASRQIAVQSQRLSEEMMKDSVAMKTVLLPLRYPYPRIRTNSIISSRWLF